MAGLAEPLGTEISLEDLSLPRARRVAELLAGGKLRYARYQACRRTGSGSTTVEAILFEADVEVPSHPAYPIQRVEPLAAVFQADDARLPECLSLRDDFPQVPHVNLGLTEYPRSFCLYNQPWSTIRMTWTAASFIERIRDWLRLTARGELHGADQPLEPLLLLWDHPIVLPSRLFDTAAGSAPDRLQVVPTDAGSGLDRSVLLAYPLGDPRGKNGLKLVATTFKCTPQPHGVIRSNPSTVADLDAFTKSAGLDLVASLRVRIREWLSVTDIHQAHLAIVIWFPKTRNAGGAPETSDVWAFATLDDIRTIGESLGVWKRHDGKLGLVIGEPAADSASLRLSLLNPMSRLTPVQAAKYNGLEASDDRKCVAIGCGSLGSQVLLNLARAGFGRWTLVDNDRVYPHNLARHALDGAAVGHHKARALAWIMNSLTDAGPVAAELIVDVLAPGETDSALDTAIQDASLVLDLSASVPVARHLVHRMAPAKRKASAFLNPSGTDFVLLVEDAEGRVPLDVLEHQMYRAVLNDDRLKAHFNRPGGWLRYAQSCRDVSSQLPHDSAALFGAVGARAIRTALASPDAGLTIWQSSADLTVAKIDVLTSPAIRRSAADWQLVTDQALLDRLFSLRAERLPRETGGVLLGSFDLDRKVAYIIDTIPSPPDSGEWPTGYIRGAKKLLPRLNAVRERTGGMLQYVGEWHSHPDGCSCAPSVDDCVVFVWLTGLMDRDGFPSLMLIMGEGGAYVPYLGKMEAGQLP